MTRYVVTIYRGASYRPSYASFVTKAYAEQYAVKMQTTYPKARVRIETETA